MAASAQEALSRARLAARALWQNQFLWRWLALALAGLALIAWLAPRQFVPPLAPTYLAVLSEPRSQKAVLVISAGRSDSALWVRTLEPKIHNAGDSLHLWALPKGRAPRSLGVLAAGETSVVALGAAAEQALAGVTMLAVSVEPRGGSTSGMPTGAMLYSGPCVKYW